MAISIGIVDDDMTLVSSICDYVELRQYKLVFSAGNLDALLKTDDYPYDPDVILLDEYLADKSGIEALTELKKKFKSTYFIIMTGDTNQELIMKAIENGASGFLYKPFSLMQMDEAVKHLVDAGSYLHPLSTTKLIRTIQKAKEIERKALKELTTKELEIVQLLIVGKSYKEISHLLGKSFHTVNFHIKNMYAKLSVNSRAQLVHRLNKKKK
jgi:DNA-binding NarL/FixJ family response regulator